MFANIKNAVKLRFSKKEFEVESVDSGKLNYLESLRGLAALCVVFAHIVALFYPGASSGGILAGPVHNEVVGKLFYGLPLGFLVNGHFAVVLFFTLSGFVLTYKYFQSKNEKDIYKQAAKRYFRLAIPIFCVVMLSFVMISFNLFSNIGQIAGMTKSSEAMSAFGVPGIGDFGFALYNAIAGVIINRDAFYDPVLWTMSTEMMGSFVVFGLALISGSLKKKWPFYVISIILLSNTYYVCFVLGMLLADIANNTKIIKKISESSSYSYTIAALIFVWVIACSPTPSPEIHGMVFDHLAMNGFDPMYSYKVWEFIAAFVLLGVVLSTKIIRRLLSGRLLIYLGGLSFSIYLTHYLVLYSIGSFSFVNLRKYFGYNASALITAAVCLIVTLIVSIAWKKYVDDMSVKVSRSFANYILK